MKSALIIAVFAVLGSIWFCPAAACDDEPALTLMQRDVDDEIGRQLQEAMLMLDSDRDPARAAPLFREIWNNAGATHKQKGLALYGLVRCERQLGHNESAELLQKELTENYPDLPHVSSPGRFMFGVFGDDGASGTRYESGIEALTEGRFLDLDTGGVFSSHRSGTVPELLMSQGAVKFLVNIVPDSVMADCAQWLSDTPWHRLQTDRGLTAWVQILRAREPAVVRFITHLPDGGEPLPVVSGLFCVGNGDTIDVHFHPSDEYQSYRIERRDAHDSAFVKLKETRKTIFSDTKVEPGQRYTYRVTGITKEGHFGLYTMVHYGLPATIAATTETRGVYSGKVTLEKKWFDFFTGEYVEQGGDFFFENYYGSMSCISLRDFLGNRTYTFYSHNYRDCRTPWNEGRCWQIPPFIPFLVPLNGGGVARCSWIPFEGQSAVLEYEVNPDAAHFAIKPALMAIAKGKSVEIDVWEPEDYEVENLAAFSLPGVTVRTLSVSGRKARDRVVGNENVIVYEAAGVDKHGRRTTVAETAFFPGPEGPRDGEFRFHFQQGYSIEQERMVPAREADVVFIDSSAEIKSFELYAPGGITNLDLRRREWEMFKHFSAPAIYETVVAIDPAKTRFVRQARGHYLDSGSDVFYLRTRHGGWARLVITEREQKGFWSDRKATVRYTFNPREPVFDELSGKVLFPKENLIIDSNMHSKLHAEAEEIAQQRRDHVFGILAELDEHTKTVAKKMGPNAAVASLLGRAYASDLKFENDYITATYSFEHMTRDDVKKTRNEWELQFGNGGNNNIHVRMVTDDESRIWDLGSIDFDAVARSEIEALEGKERVTAVEGHVYIINTKDSDTDHWVKMQILNLKENEWMIFRWEFLDEDSLDEKLKRRIEEIKKEREKQAENRSSGD